MNSRRLIVQLLTPSLLSGSSCLLLSITSLGIANYTAFLKDAALYGYLSGQNGLDALSNRQGSSSLDIGNLFLSSKVAALLFASMAIILIILSLQGLHKFIGNLHNPYMRHETLQRFSVRLVVAIAWLLYGLAFYRLLLPFCILTSHVGINLLWHWMSFAYLLFGLSLLAALVHIHIIFIRLLMLRPRVFGGTDESVLSESSNNPL